jgi:hypothetical protein
MTRKSAPFASRTASIAAYFGEEAVFHHRGRRLNGARETFMARCCGGPSCGGRPDPLLSADPLLATGFAELHEFVGDEPVAKLGVVSVHATMALMACASVQSPVGTGRACFLQNALSDPVIEVGFSALECERRVHAEIPTIPNATGAS